VVTDVVTDMDIGSMRWEVVQQIRRAIQRDNLTITTAVANLDRAVWQRDCDRQVSGDLDLEPAVYWQSVVTVLRHDLGVLGAAPTSFGHGDGDGGGDDGRRDSTAGRGVQP
jgi:hypothetical protein